MAQLRDDYDEFRGRRSEVIVAGPEKPAAFKAYWRKHRIPFLNTALRRSFNQKGFRDCQQSAVASANKLQ
jgi:hypothetical protein